MPTRHHLAILPTHPLRAGYDRTVEPGSVADRFQRRLEPDRFHPAYLRDLTSRIERALAAAPDDELSRYRLAFVLLQNNATAADVDRAARLLTGTSLPQGRRLTRLIDAISLRTEQPRVGRRVTRVNWSITNRCPMSCQGCYNPFAAEQISLDQAKGIVDKLAEHGTTDLVLAGGDPLLWPPIHQVVDHATAAGIRVALDTTGYTLTADKLARLSALSSLRLPLDGVTAEAQRAFRRSPDRNLHAALLESLRLCDQVGFTRVRVHTVANAKNLHQLDAIAEEVFSHPSVAQWVVFQWWGRRASPATVRALAVDPAELRSAVRSIRQRHPDREIILAEAAERELLNWMIQSSGQVVTFGSGPEEEFILGNLLTDSIETILTRPILDFDAMARGVPVTPRSARSGPPST
ncbi:radical SAM protein [Kitasatospora viridis]|uniref:4Fe-4S single cluster protein n=1 Tax=Kitasatospora viridis TaxID=281105 RepID=A0A561UMT3_9ACTN|nr:radical SAM protein [Kitasatospora viridis]TWG00669.1 4Fe-4S single cluster protein [Kitasatospora viridis]